MYDKWIPMQDLDPRALCQRVLAHICRDLMSKDITWTRFQKVLRLLSCHQRRHRHNKDGRLEATSQGETLWPCKTNVRRVRLREPQWPQLSVPSN